MVSVHDLNHPLFADHFRATRYVAQYTRGTPTNFLFRVAAECDFDEARTAAYLFMVRSLIQRTLLAGTEWDRADAELLVFHRATFRREEEGG